MRVRLGNEIDVMAARRFLQRGDGSLGQCGRRERPGRRRPATGAGEVLESRRRQQEEEVCLVRVDPETMLHFPWTEDKGAGADRARLVAEPEGELPAQHVPRLVLVLMSMPR